MLCDFLTTALPNGHYRHACRRPGCGRDVQTAVAACALRCRAGHSRSGSAGVPALAGASRDDVLHRMTICRDCTERPEGCWKTREYGCQRAYREAGRRAAETADCPIRKL